MKKTSIAVLVILHIFVVLTACADYAENGIELKWKDSDEKAATPKIVGVWSDDSSYYIFSAEGTYDAYFEGSKTRTKGFWKENTEGKIYFCNEPKIVTSSVFTYVGYVINNQFIRDHICYRDTYQKTQSKAG